MEWVGEKGQIEKSVGPFLRQRMEETNTFCTITALPSMASKSQRAQSIRGRAAMGKLYLPKHIAWAAEMYNEMLHFPNGTHDDYVDALALMGRVLDTTYSPSLQVLSKRNKDIRFGSNILNSAREAKINPIMETA